MTTGEKLKQARKKKGWTQDELAKMVDIDISALGRLERDTAMLNIDLAVQLADLLDISLDYLARDKNLTAIKEETLPEKFTKQLQKLEQLSPSDVSHILAVLDAFVTKAQLQSMVK